MSAWDQLAKIKILMETEGLKGPAAGAPPRPVSGPAPESQEAKSRRLAIQGKQGLKEGPGDVVNKFKRRAVSTLSKAFTAIENAHFAGQKDVAASKANFAGEELDQLMRELSQALLGGSNER